jgi:general stress protein 26
MGKEPVITRPHMPGYGTLPATEGTGLLPWSWAQERLVASRNYWMVTVWPVVRGPRELAASASEFVGLYGRPHAMPVWGMWHDDAFWFSSSRTSRKAKNLAANPRCVVTTEDALNPVVVEGTAELLTNPAEIAMLLALENAKYETDYKIEMLDPAVNSCFRVHPKWAFGIEHGDFEGSPTRWEFER